MTSEASTLSSLMASHYSAEANTMEVTDSFSLSAGLIAMLVLGALCVILGAIYGYIYFTRINPRSQRARTYLDQTPQDEEQSGQGASTHLFLFRKS